MIIDNFNSIIYDLIIFYNSLNLFGIILLAVIVATIILLFVLIISILRRKYKLKNQIKEKVSNSLVVTKEVKPISVNQLKEDILNNNLTDIVEQTAKRNIVKLDDITKKIEQDMEMKNIILTSFEEEQEENSIISYDELLEKTTKLSLNTIKQQMNEDKNVEISPVVEEPKKTINSPLILPTHDINEDVKMLKNDDNLEKIQKFDTKNVVIKKDIEFLKELKDLKRNLD